MDAESLAALAQIFIAVAVIVGGGGGAVYVVRRKTNGQSALPGTGDAHDETLHELRAITKQLQKNGEANAKDHKDMLDYIAPRRVPGGGGS